MAQPVRPRRLTEEEGRRLVRIVRRGTRSSVRFHRALIIMASASGNTVPAIARLVAADEDTVRAVIHRFNEIGLDCLGPHWAGGRPRRISPKDEAFLVQTAQTRPDNAPVHVICDNLSVNTTPKIRRWAARNGVHLCLTPTYASWANPIEAQFGPVRSFVMNNANHPNHTVLARHLQAYLRWRNTHARDPSVLAAQRRERARIRSERHQRWGRPRPHAA